MLCLETDVLVESARYTPQTKVPSWHRDNEFWGAAPVAITPSFENQASAGPTHVSFGPCVVSHQMTDAWELLLSELESYAMFENGWDGSDSFPANSDDISGAKAILMSLPSGIPLPTPMLSKAGQVGLFWNHEAAYVDIHLEPNHRFSMYLRSKNGKVFEKFFDDQELEQAGPEWFDARLASLFKG